MIIKIISSEFVLFIFIFHVYSLKCRECNKVIILTLNVFGHEIM